MTKKILIWATKPHACTLDVLSFIFPRPPVLDSKVCWDLRYHGKSASGSGSTVGLKGMIDSLAYRANEKPRSAFRQREVDWPRGPAQRQLPTAACVEGSCSQGLKVQSLCKMDILIWKKAQLVSSFFSAVIEHDYGSHFYSAFFLEC